MKVDSIPEDRVLGHGRAGFAASSWRSCQNAHKIQEQFSSDEEVNVETIQREQDLSALR